MEEAPFIKGQPLFYLHHSAACQANLSTAWQLRAFKFSRVRRLAGGSLRTADKPHEQKHVKFMQQRQSALFRSASGALFLATVSRDSHPRSSGAKNRFFFPGENTAARTKSKRPCVHAMETKRLLRMMEYRQRRAMHRQFVQLYK